MTDYNALQPDGPISYINDPDVDANTTMLFPLVIGVRGLPNCAVFSIIINEIDFDGNETAIDKMDCK